MKRYDFMKTIGIFGLASISQTGRYSNLEQNEPQLDKAIVEQFVAAAHKDMEQVKILLHEFPTLLNAAHDWGFGDFETGLGAATHVGYKQLAQYFIDEGAQANIFTAALFGRMEILLPMLHFFPSAINAKGPHGYTLLHHAQEGGEDALEVKKYLISLGARKTLIQLY